MLYRLAPLMLVALLVSCGATGPSGAADATPKHAKKPDSRRGARARRQRKRRAAPAPTPATLTANSPAASAPSGAVRSEQLHLPIYDPSGQAMRPFHAALARAAAGEGQARIAFWGASHTAADLWTGQVRRALQLAYGDAGHGYMMPVRWHLGLRHQDVNVKASTGWQVSRYRQVDPVPVGDYGYGGVAVSSDDPEQWITFSTCTDNVCGRKAEVVEVWVRNEPKGGTLLVTIDGVTHKRSTRAKLTAAKEHRFELPDGAHTVEIRPAGDGPVWLYGVVMQRKVPGVILDQMGIPGMRGSIVLHWREQNWRRHVQRRAPDLLVLAYGTNAVGDTHRPIRRFVARWRRVLQRVKRAAPGASCLLVGPTDRPHKPDAHGVRRHRQQQDLVIAAQKQVAAEFGCGFWDAAAAMGGRGGMLRWVAAGLARGDHVHLSREGYALKAERFLWALLQGVPPRTARNDGAAAPAPP